MSYKVTETRSRDEQGRDWTHVLAEIGVSNCEEPYRIQVDVEHGTDGRYEKRLKMARTIVVKKAIAFIKANQ